MNKRMRKNRHTFNIIFYLILLLFLVTSGITFAIMYFETGENLDINLAVVDVNSNIDMVSNVGMVAPGDIVVNNAEFTKASNSKNLYVRANVEFYSNDANLTREEKNYIVALNSYDYSDNISTNVNGVEWLNTHDNNYYLVNSDGDFKLVDDNTTYGFATNLIFPSIMNLQNLGFEMDNSIDDLKLRVRFQGIQSDYLDDGYDIIDIFNIVFEEDDSKEYLVQFDTNSDTKITPQVVGKNSVITNVDTPLKQGYIFNNWTLDGLFVNINTYKVTNNITYVASYLDEVVATFVCEGEVVSHQSVGTGGYAQNVAVQSTTYKVFNGWKVNGQLVDIATYHISEDTIFNADIIYKYDVLFIVDGLNYNSQIVSSGNNPIVPTNPKKDGYTFIGWTLDGVNIIDISNQTINQNTTYVARFKMLYVVTFVYEDEVRGTQNVIGGEFAEDIYISSTAYKVFNGWKVNDTIVNVATYTINSNVVFIADITYKYDVKFVTELGVYNSQVVMEGGKASLIANPVKDGYTFKGWSLDNITVVNIGNMVINGNTTFIALFEVSVYEVVFKNGEEVVSTQNIVYNDYLTLPQNPTKQNYIFDGWSLDGVNPITNIDKLPITEDLIYLAVFTRLYNVSFLVDGVVYDSQVVRGGEYAINPTAPTKTGYALMGWGLDEYNICNISQKAIDEDIEFNAIFDVQTNGLFTVVVSGTTYYLTVLNGVYNMYYDYELATTLSTANSSSSLGAWQDVKIHSGYYFYVTSYNSSTDSYMAYWSSKSNPGTSYNIEFTRSITNGNFNNKNYGLFTVVVSDTTYYLTVVSGVFNMYYDYELTTKLSTANSGSSLGAWQDVKIHSGYYFYVTSYDSITDSYIAYWSSKSNPGSTYDISFIRKIIINKPDGLFTVVVSGTTYYLTAVGGVYNMYYDYELTTKLSTANSSSSLGAWQDVKIHSGYYFYVTSYDGIADGYIAYWSSKSNPGTSYDIVFTRDTTNPNFK